MAMSESEYILALLNTIQKNVESTSSKVDHILEIVDDKLDKLSESLNKRIELLEEESDSMNIEIIHVKNIRNTANFIIKAISIAVIGLVITGIASMMHFTYPAPTSANADTPPAITSHKK